MALEDVAQAILLFFIGSGLIAFIIQSIVKHVLDKDIESYKNRISQEQFKLTKLHEERAYVIRELYEKLADMELAMHSYTNPLQLVGDISPTEKGKRASDATNDFMIFIRKNRIYFDKSTAELLDNIHEIAKRAFIKVRVYRIHDSLSSMANTKEQNDAWIECFDAINKTLPELRSKLEREFRTILGVPTE